MWARALCALLLVAAVLSMHGIPSMGEAHAAEEGAGAPSHSMMGASPEAPLQVPAALAGASGMTLDLAPGTGTSDLPHEVTAHLWDACLAVLLAGLLVVGIAMLRRRRPSCPGVDACWPAASWGRTRSSVPRPPDLFALCVMRT